VLPERRRTPGPRGRFEQLFGEDWRGSSFAEKAGVFRRRPSEADGESRGAYFLYASTLDAGIAKVSAEIRRPSRG
jgi:hypothetical protein